MEAERDQRLLRRLIARLVGLAELADRAAGRCFAIRFLVLLVLHRAETAARDHVLDMVETAFPVADGPFAAMRAFVDDREGAGGFGAADAALLALRLRALASLLVALLGAPSPVCEAPPRAGRASARRADALRLAPPAPIRDAQRHPATGPPQDRKPDAGRPGPGKPEGLRA